ncbi:MAG: hypothetical protein J7L54_03065 [Elusimicrobia bacterium]|nr:hypothetical protein [Elusimicrobiota bacterium]
MNEINERIGEILELEKNSQERITKEKEAAARRIKEALKKREAILEEAEADAQKKADALEVAKKKEAEAEAKKIILDAELNAKKISGRILKQKKEIFKILLSQVQESFDEKNDIAGK